MKAPGTGGATEALNYYRAALRHRPDSFWANYRAAAVAFGLGLYDDALSAHTPVRGAGPDNPTLRVRLVGCLSALASTRNPSGVDRADRAAYLSEAVSECDRAQTLPTRISPKPTSPARPAQSNSGSRAASIKTSIGSRSSCVCPPRRPPPWLST